MFKQSLVLLGVLCLLQVSLADSGSGPVDEGLLAQIKEGLDEEEQGRAAVQTATQEVSLKKVQLRNTESDIQKLLQQIKAMRQKEAIRQAKLLKVLRNTETRIARMLRQLKVLRENFIKRNVAKINTLKKRVDALRTNAKKVVQKLNRQLQITQAQIKALQKRVAILKQRMASIKQSIKNTLAKNLKEIQILQARLAKLRQHLQMIRNRLKKEQQNRVAQKSAVDKSRLILAKLVGIEKKVSESIKQIQKLKRQNESDLDDIRRADQEEFMQLSKEIRQIARRIQEYEQMQKDQQRAFATPQ